MLVGESAEELRGNVGGMLGVVGERCPFSLLLSLRLCGFVESDFY